MNYEERGIGEAVSPSLIIVYTTGSFLFVFIIKGQKGGWRIYLRVAVEHWEIGDDDRDRQGDGQHASQSAKGTDKHSHVRFGCHISVAHLSFRIDEFWFACQKVDNTRRDE